MQEITTTTSSHALLSVFTDNGIERIFLVPGESYLGILDALNDFPNIDTVTCRHEGGAGFMACAEGRLSKRPGVVMVSRGPGATNASIAVHTAQQDAIPLILVIGQIPKRDLRKEAFQEIDYQKMFGSIAKWVFEATEPEQLAEAAFKAVRIATSGTPGPVVLVIPEDIQQQGVPVPVYETSPFQITKPHREDAARIAHLVGKASRPLIIAGGALDTTEGRAALLKLAEYHQIPVAVSFRQHDIFPNNHPLFAGELGLANPPQQIELFAESDLIIALGTRLGDITTQGYTFPQSPKAIQKLVHCYPDAHPIGLNHAADVPVVCSPHALAEVLTEFPAEYQSRSKWIEQVTTFARQIHTWPTVKANDGVPFVEVVREVAASAPADLIVCLDAGTFAAPVYKHFPFVYPQRLIAPLSGAMGYGVPSAIAAQLRYPGRKVVCMVGDGGFLMTGNEMIAAVERQLPILFIVSNNNCYGAIRIHQERHYPGRNVGTALSNPDFTKVAEAFGVTSERISEESQISAALDRGLSATGPYLIEVSSSLCAVLPKQVAGVLNGKGD